MPDSAPIDDLLQRELSETTFDRNVIVIAGAGTGKTTLLVNRLVHLLMKQPDPVSVTRVVALTFTNKAATEMKMRLRERLTALLHPANDTTASSEGGAVTRQALRDRYNLSTADIVQRAEFALRDLEKAQIGTIHSFAAHLLRLYPLESGVDPSFQEDDGLRFEEHFTQAWDVWIGQELSRGGGHHDVWRDILRTAGLDDVRVLVRSLCSELVDLEALRTQLARTQPDTVLTQWLTETRDQAQALLQRYDRPKRRKIEHMVAAAAAVATTVIEHGPEALETLAPSGREWLAKDPGNPVDGWEPADFKDAVRLIRTARRVLDVDDRFFRTVADVLIPIVEEIRRSFSAKGRVSFDGLLAKARALLRDHPAIRERVKQDYRAVLVDEFQDTDPVQYEIILAVSEGTARHARDWQDMVLEPGKLFIVGDPKQSIYAFRRADIEAFDRVVRKIELQQGTVHTLTTNFRSDGAVLGPVNDVFDRLFERRLHVQPANVRLEVHPQRRPSSLEAGMRLHLVSPPVEEAVFDAAEATRAEAEILARWIRDDLLSRVSVKPGHVALLFRKLTQADAYLDALRRYGIPYVIEGEKHFYRRQEVIDLINLLRILDNPHDSIALAGVLRSPLGGLNDRELYELRQRDLFEYLRPDRLVRWDHSRAGSIRRLYSQLAALRRDVIVRPLADAVQLVFDRLFILELAAASLHGEQAVANLLKVKHTAASLSDRPHLTLAGFVELMIARLDDQPDEAESPLAEESPEAVHVLTIHKAKGLEFPVVVLPGLHQGTGRERALPSVAYDWSSGQYGISLGDRRTFGAVLVHEKAAVREDAERRRVLYVGMTRAKEMLMLSGGVTGRAAGETVLDLLQGIGEGEIGVESTKNITIGRSVIPHAVVAAVERRRPRRTSVLSSELSPLDPTVTALRWQARMARWTTARATPLRLSPTRLDREQERPAAFSSRKTNDRDRSLMVGILAHRVLERWDFSTPVDRFFDHFSATLEAVVAADQQEQLPVLLETLQDLFIGFSRSAAYAKLRSATILGREIPFIMPWEHGQVMEGVIDLIYRLDGRIWIADYKTDRIASDEAAARAERYARQATIYRAAVNRCLKQPAAAFEFVFLRPGVIVEMEGG